jgi:transposase InsO family protein
MRELGLKSVIRRKKYKSYRGEVGKVADNILQREFNTLRPNHKWATDVTEFNVLGEKRYLSAVLDMYNREIVSYEAGARPDYTLVGKMLKRALKRINKTDNLLLHSDQGWQYQQKKYQAKLRSKNVTQSMSRRGNCLDNAVMENFFGHVKSEMFYTQKFKDVKEFDRELKKYMLYYNTERIQEKLNGLSPVAYRTQAESITKVQLVNKVPC